MWIILLWAITYGNRGAEEIQMSVCEASLQFWQILMKHFTKKKMDYKIFYRIEVMPQNKTQKIMQFCNLQIETVSDCLKLITTTPFESWTKTFKVDFNYLELNFGSFLIYKYS